MKKKCSTQIEIRRRHGWLKLQLVSKLNCGNEQFFPICSILHITGGHGDDLCYNCDSQNIIRSTNWMTAGMSERRVTNTYSKKKVTNLVSCSSSRA